MLSFRTTILIDELRGELVDETLNFRQLRDGVAIKDLGRLFGIGTFGLEVLPGGPFCSLMRFASH